MQNSTWKLAALAGVVGIGFLVVLQTQRGLSRHDVAVDEQADSGDQGPDHSRESHAELSLGVSDSGPEPVGSKSTPVLRQFSPSEFPTGPKTDGGLASGQSEPQSETGSDNGSSRPSAQSSAAISPPNHSAAQEGHTAAKRGSAVPDDGGGLDFRSQGPKTLPVATGQAANAPDLANPFATVPPSVSTVTPVGGTQQGGHAVGAKSSVSTGHDAPKQKTDSLPKSPLLADPAQADSRTPAGTAGPALVSPNPSKDADKSHGPDTAVKPKPSKDLTRSAASAGREKTLSPKPAAAFPNAKPPPSVTSPSPQPDAFNPFEPAPGGRAAEVPSAKPAARTTKTSAGTEPSSSEKPKPLSVPAATPSQKSQPKLSPAVGPSKVPRLIAPVLPLSAPKNKTPRRKSADSSGPDENPKPAVAKPIRVLGKQPLPPKTGADQKPSLSTSSTSSQDRQKGGSTSSTKTKPPQRLDIPKQVAPLKTGATDVPIRQPATASHVPRGPQKPQLKIEKVAPKDAILGQPMIYHILVKNVGRAAAHQVVVKDQIPRGVQLTGSIPRAYLTGRSLSWRLGTLKPNETRNIAVRIVPQTAGEVGSIATVNFVSKVFARTSVTAPKLSLAIDAPQTIRIGQLTQFHFKITNHGNREIHGVFIRDIIPPGLNHAAGRDLEYKIGTLPAGKTQDIRLTMKAVKSGKAVNHAIVTADGGLKVEATAAIRVVSRARLTITRTGPQQRYLGRTADYISRVTNNSEQTATAIRVVELVPDGMTFVKALSQGQYDRAKRTVTWHIDRLGPKASHALTVTLRSTKIGPQNSVVRVMTADGSKTELRSQTTVNGLATLRIDVPPVTGPVDVGNPVALRIVAANRGSAPATNVQITVMLSEELAVASARGPVKNKTTAAKIEFEPIKSIAPGQEVTFDVILRSVKPGDARVGVRTQSDQMQRSLVREEAVQILADGQ